MHRYHFLRSFFLSVFFLLMISSCSKDEDVIKQEKEIISPSDEEEDEIKEAVASFDYRDELDRYVLTNTSKGSKLTYRWKILTDNNPVSIYLTSNLNESYGFILPDISDSAFIDIRLTVKNGKGADSVTKCVPLPPMTWNRKSKLGKSLEAEIGNDVDYDWYINQSHTGQYSSVNCGPACVTMAAKWINKNFSKTTEDARNTYCSTGGWWYTSDIINYLNLHGIGNYTISLSNATDLKEQIDIGNIVILCLDIFYVRLAFYTNLPVDKFYPTSGAGAGHFIVVKGYKIVDGRIIFEVYDPWSLNYAYSDGKSMGINRLYREEDIMKATDIWWKYAIVVQNPQAANRKRTNTRAVIVDPNRIVHQKGR